MPELPSDIILKNGEINIDAIKIRFPKFKSRSLAVLDMFFNDGKTIRCIAENLGYSTSSIRNDLFFTIKTMRKNLGAEGKYGKRLR